VFWEKGGLHREKVFGCREKKRGVVLFGEFSFCIEMYYYYHLSHYFFCSISLLFLFYLALSLPLLYSYETLLLAQPVEQELLHTLLLKLTQTRVICKDISLACNAP
jgi:hypothetical protein